MKTITVLTILLTLSLANILHAGLDTDTIDNHVIAVYHFESTKNTDGGLVYTEDSGPQDLPGFLFEGASLANGGKSGKCLSLVGDDRFGAGTDTLRQCQSRLKADSLPHGAKSKPAGKL